MELTQHHKGHQIYQSIIVDETVVAKANCHQAAKQNITMATDLAPSAPVGSLDEIKDSVHRPQTPELPEPGAIGAAKHPLLCRMSERPQRRPVACLVDGWWGCLFTFLGALGGSCCSVGIFFLDVAFFFFVIRAVAIAGVIAQVPS
jgi:hypothetical protein